MTITIEHQLEWIQAQVIVAKICQPHKVEMFEAIEQTLKQVVDFKDIHFRLRPRQPLVLKNGCAPVNDQPL